MRLHIDHTTTFTYDALISEAYTEMRLKPMDAWGQRCLSFSLITEPRGEVTQYADCYGNDVRYFDVLQPHQKLVVSASSEVLTADAWATDDRPISPFERFDYLHETAYTANLPAICELASPCFTPDDPHATAFALMQAINRALKYEKGVTDVKTTAAAALELGRGVCQDYAHVMLAACRCLGMPARYVSGYLHGPNSNNENGASHAWVDVYVEGRGWISLDPTHNTPQTAQHVRLAAGCDYADVTPTRGIYTGHASETLTVRVRVYPV